MGLRRNSVGGRTTSQLVSPDPEPSLVAGIPIRSRSDVEALAHALTTLLIRDEQHPPRWLSPAFVSRVAAERTELSPIPSPRRLAARWRRRSTRERLTSPRFDAAAERLARDAAHIAFALRQLELERGVRLASWPELLRHRSLIWVGLDPASEGAIWFG